LRSVAGVPVSFKLNIEAKDSELGRREAVGGIVGLAHARV
jgi:hypothetical protein